MSSNPRTRIITLTTDFGTNDHFVGTMKGVILGIAPRTDIVDITHAIAPFQIMHGAFEIEQAWRYFPRGTIHVVVVDPGVGSDRRPILVEAGGHFFIGPDNGVFSLIYRERHKVREITNSRVSLGQMSRTFHGRDIFAPAAAHLANGVGSTWIGKLMRAGKTLAEFDPSKVASSWRGVVIKADHFGNLITNFHVDQFPEIRNSSVVVRVGENFIRKFALSYSEGESGELMVLVGSSGFLEVAAREANAQLLLKCGPGAEVELEIG